MSAMTQDETRAALQAAGYQIGSYSDFLGLTPEEESEVESQGTAHHTEGSAGNGALKNGIGHSEPFPAPPVETTAHQ